MAEWTREKPGDLGGSPLGRVAAASEPVGAAAGVYSSSAGARALILPLGRWLSAKSEGVRWTQASGSVQPDEHLGVLSETLEDDALESLQRASRADGLDVALFAFARSGGAAGSVAAGRLAFDTAPDSALDVWRIKGVAAVAEPPPSMRKRGEGPDHLRGREQWFRGRTDPKS